MSFTGISQGYLREAKCHLAMGEIATAIIAYNTVLQLEPQNSTAKNEVSATCSMLLCLLSITYFNLVAWWCSGQCVINRLRVRYPAMHCRVSTWLSDRLWADKPSRYVTGHLGQLSLPSLRGR